MSEENEGAAAMPSSEDIFASAVAETTAESSPEADDGPPRDEHGRFSAKQPEEATEVEAETPQTEEAPQADEQKNEVEPVAAQEKGPGPVPYDRFREVIEQNRQLMQLLQRQTSSQPTVQQENKQPQVDPIDMILNDPGAFVGQQIDPVRDELRQVREEFSRLSATTKHGEEKVTAAYKALDDAIRDGQMNGEQVRSHLQQSRDPYGEIVAWHEAEQDRADPSRALRRQIESMPEDARKAFLGQFGLNPSQTQQQNQPSPSVVKLPPSLNRQTGASSNAADQADMSSAALFRHAVGK